MSTDTKIILGLGGIALGIYLLKKKSAATPAGPATATPAAGGGNGANQSISSAFNGIIPTAITDLTNWFSGAGASAGHLPNGNGGAQSVVSPAQSGQADYGYGVDANGYDADGNYVGA